MIGLSAIGSRGGVPFARCIGIRVLVLALLASACAEERDPLRQMVVRDSLGTRIVEYPSGTLERLGPWTIVDTVWSLTGLAEMGDGTPSVITDALLVDTLKVAVLSVLDHAIYVYERWGVASSVLGREGDGPGEFRNPVQLIHWPGERFGAWDDRASTLTVFDGGLEQVDRVALPREYTAQRLQKLVGSTRDGGVVAPITPLELEVFGRRPHAPGEGLHQDSLYLRLFPRSGENPMDLVAVPGIDKVRTRSGRRVAEEAPLFGRQPYAAVAGGRLVVAAADRFELSFLDGQAPTQIVRLAYQPPVVSDESREKALDEWQAGVRARAPFFRRQGDDDPSRMSVRDTMPVLAGMIGEVSGALWVSIYDVDYSQRQWVRIAKGGTLLGRTTLAAQMDVLDARFPFLLVRVPAEYGLTSLLWLRLGWETEEGGA